MHVEGSVQLAVSGDGQLFCAGDPVIDGLTRVLLHLNVVKLAEIAEPLDELGGDASVELHIREVGLQHVGAGVTGVKEHELGLFQVIG